jgi:SAM-dependent methyltransferase
VAASQQALAEFARTLKPGGILVLTMPAYQWMYSYHDREVGNVRRYSRREVAAMMKVAGLAVVDDTYWNMLPFPLAVLRRKLLPPTKSTSDVHLFPPVVERMFNGLMALEHSWLGRGGRLPFGNSVLTVAKKV